MLTADTITDVQIRDLMRDVERTLDVGCLKKLASIPTDKAERRAWLQKHGVNHDGSR